MDYTGLKLSSPTVNPTHYKTTFQFHPVSSAAIIPKATEDKVPKLESTSSLHDNQETAFLPRPQDLTLDFATDRICVTTYLPTNELRSSSNQRKSPMKGQEKNELRCIK